MRKFHLFTPGPTMVPGAVRLAGAQDMIHHRTPEFEQNIYAEVHKLLKVVFQTEQEILCMMSTGTGAMETAVTNLAARGEKVIVFNGGKFGERWTKICKAYGIDVHEVLYPWSEVCTPDKLNKAIADCPEAKVIFCQLSETSAGTVNPVKDLAAITRNTERILVVDGISGIGATPCPPEEWGVDVIISGSQKGFMMPPGLAFLTLNDKAWKKVETTARQTFYFDLIAAKKNHALNTTPWTPNVTLYQQLLVALKMITEEGMDRVFARCARQAEAIRTAVHAHGLTILSEKYSGSVLTAVNMPEGVDSGKIVKFCRDKWGLYFAGGQDDYKGKILRIGHLGYTDDFEVIMCIVALEIALKLHGFDLELGKGVKAAEEMLVAKYQAGEQV